MDILGFQLSFPWIHSRIRPSQVVLKWMKEWIYCPGFISHDDILDLHALCLGWWLWWHLYGLVWVLVILFSFLCMICCSQNSCSSAVNFSMHPMLNHLTKLLKFVIFLATFLLVSCFHGWLVCNGLSMTLLNCAYFDPGTLHSLLIIINKS